MQADELLDDFNERRFRPDLPFVLQDAVEVLDGVYAGKRGEVVLLAYADGTDELLTASSLRLLHRDT